MWGRIRRNFAELMSDSRQEAVAPMRHSVASVACSAVITILFISAPFTGIAADATIDAALLSRCVVELGISLVGEGTDLPPGGKAEGVVADPQKLALCGLTEVAANAKVTLEAPAGGGLRVMVEGGAQQTLSLPDAGGYWRFMAQDLGIKVDAPPPVGRGVLALCGVIADAAKLAALGVAGVETDMRAELWSPRILEQPKQLPEHLRGTKLPPGSWSIVLLGTRGMMDLGGSPLASPTGTREFFSACLVYGIGLDDIKIPASGGKPELSTLGSSQVGKGAILGAAVSPERLAVLGLEGAAEGDRAHFVPQDKDAWRLAICGPVRAGEATAACSVRAEQGEIVLVGQPE